MVGITSYGAYVPWYRIKRATIYSAMGWLNPATFLPGEKAVANYDEDSISMAVNAAKDCLDGFDEEKIDGLYFATTTLPYKERQNAEIIATALNLRPDIKIADFTGSTKAGTTALLSAYDAIKAGSVSNILVCASDCRLGKAGSSQEESYGDAAAAILLGNTDIISSLEGFSFISYDFMDHWRADTDEFDRSWEDRWIRDEGYTKFIPEAISRLAKKINFNVKDVTKACYPCLYLREHEIIGKSLGLSPDQIQEHMFTTVGNTGTAYPLLILVSALEDANPGDNIILASYGAGSDALLFKATEKINTVGKKGSKKYLVSKKYLDSYEKYCTFRDTIPIEKGIRGEEIRPTATSVLWRERKGLLGLVGSRCKRCGTPQFPRQDVCVNPDCGAVNEMEEYNFSDKKSHLVSYTEDHLTFTPIPPAIYGIINFDGGGRYIFDITDCEPGTLKVGMPMKMNFRRKYVDKARGIHNYFWKGIPIKEE